MLTSTSQTYKKKVTLICRRNLLSKTRGILSPLITISHKIITKQHWDRCRGQTILKLTLRYQQSVLMTITISNSSKNNPITMPHKVRCLCTVRPNHHLSTPTKTRILVKIISRLIESLLNKFTTTTIIIVIAHRYKMPSINRNNNTCNTNKRSPLNNRIKQAMIITSNNSNISKNQ